MNKLFKSILSVSAAITVASATLTPAIVSAWGDSSESGRPSYTNEQIEGGILKDTITFNSISNGAIGNEKNFVGARLASSNGNFEPNTLKVKPGEIYTIRLYVHNNSPKGVNGMAKGVHVYFRGASLSAKDLNIGKTHTITGYLGASNATPNLYWDEIQLVADEDVYLDYVMDSAIFANDKLGEVKLSNDAIVTGSKITIGYDAMNGEIPGCYPYTGVVSFKVKVNSIAAAEISKVARLKGEPDSAWREKVDAKVGDEVEFQIKYTNKLSQKVNNVIIRDLLPKNIEYVKNSTYLFNSNYQKGVFVEKNTVTTNGVNIGNYEAGAIAYIRFTGKVVNKSLKCGSNTVKNVADVTVNGKVYEDGASVVVDKTCDKDTPEPTPEPDEPTPDNLPSTGPATIVTGTIGAGATVTMLGYYIASRKKLM